MPNISKVTITSEGVEVSDWPAITPPNAVAAAAIATTAGRHDSHSITVHVASNGESAARAIADNAMLQATPAASFDHIIDAGETPVLASVWQLPRSRSSTSRYRPGNVPAIAIANSTVSSSVNATPSRSSSPPASHARNSSPAASGNSRYMRYTERSIIMMSCRSSARNARGAVMRFPPAYGADHACSIVTVC
ncbi:hypothetical protein BIGA_3052 [Bifidobacterium pullorum subsp. gallinarum]|uniref:Uncharacterized protein n=1 Tax=Bifidobacterium pullorum subsp. gallinarum TaxID=78344 RepID=A0A087AS38_9BIFI|nr:hypothetical protein BIGA_3052 [Bifidobacterium pullorum subsp. gallinarum]